MNTKISQSLLKALSEYIQGILCGYVFYHRFILRDSFDFDSEAKRLGNYFEYYSTGSLPRSGIAPVAEYDSKGSMRAPFQRALQSSFLFKRAKEDLGLSIADVGVSLETENLIGILDIVGVFDGKPCIVDLKYSGLIDDKFNDMGWHPDFLPEKDNILMQGVHYKILFRKLMGKDADFYFWVFDSSNPEYFRIIKLEVSEERIQQHYGIVQKAIDYISARPQKTDWQAYPSMKSCLKCQLAANCEKRTNYPIIETINY